MERPKVGIGVIIENPNGEVLIGKRKGSHAPYYSIPGGHLEQGETFEEAGIKETMEETGLRIINPIVLCVTNNLRTFREEQKHYISIILYTRQFSGEARVLEPDKCEKWEWMKPSAVPDPQFDASEFALECFRNSQFYIPDQS